MRKKYTQTGLKNTVLWLFLLLVAPLCIATAQTGKRAPPSMDAIKSKDLKNDIFTMASDSMRGRRAGTLDELRAAAWVAKRAEKAGLEPAGDDGTYFQFFNLKRTTVSKNSIMKINGATLPLWKQAWVTSPIDAQLETKISWQNNMVDTTTSLKGKVIGMDLLPPSKLPAEGMSLWVYRYALSAIREQAGQLIKQGAKAVILIADSTAQSKIGFFGHGFEEGKYAIEGMETPDINRAPVILLSHDWKGKLTGNNVTVALNLNVDQYDYPSENVVAKVPGTDAKLKNEYVLFSGHHDHDGVGVPLDGDSIWNGADDNASVSVAMLAIGRAFAKNPANRTALFVWHGAEERGLLGSRYFVNHPTIPKEAIVAVLNGDMIGRNAGGEAALLGSIPPHRNSQQLMDMAMSANAAITKFKVDTSWDEESHPEFWYFRSDHLPYARAGIPSIFFTTLLHPDYHTPSDEADRIDIPKLTKMTKWIYATGWEAANASVRPKLDAPQPARENKQ